MKCLLVFLLVWSSCLILSGCSTTPGQPSLWDNTANGIAEADCWVKRNLW